MFDNTGKLISDAEISKADKIEMFRKRREDAVALWATIPDKKFYIGSFKNSCGTTCCAIGWLAELQYDGWKFDRGEIPIRMNINDTVLSIQSYFGLDWDSTRNCFFTYHKTLKSVSKELLASEYEKEYLLGKKNA